MKTATVGVERDGGISIEFGGTWDGICCGPEERELLAALKRLGIVTDLAGLACHLPDAGRKAAVLGGDCVTTIRKGERR